MDEDRDSLAFVLSIYTRPRKIVGNSAISKFLSKCKVPKITETKISEFTTAATESHDIFPAAQLFLSDFEFSFSSLEEFLMLSKKFPNNLAKAIPFVYSCAIGFFIRLNDDIDFNKLDVVLESLFNLATVDPSYSLFIYLLIVERALAVAGDVFPEKTFLFICAQVCFYEKPCAKCLYVLLDMLKRSRNNDVLGMRVINSMQKIVTDLSRLNIQVNRESIAAFLEEELHYWAKTIFNSLYVVSRMSYHEEYGRLYRMVGEAIVNEAEKLNDEFFVEKELYFDDSVCLSDEDFECDRELECDVTQLVTQIEQVSCLPVAEMLGKEVAHKLECVRFMFGKDLDRQYIEDFLCGVGMLQDTRNDIGFKKLCVMLGSFIQMNWKPQNVVIDRLFDNRFFDSSQTIFFGAQEMKRVSFFRQKIVEIVFLHARGNLDYFFEKFAEHPMLFSEILLRSLSLSVFRCLSTRFLEIYVDNEKRLRKLWAERKMDVILVARSCNLAFFIKMFSETTVRSMIGNVFGIATKVISMASEKSFTNALRRKAHRLILEPNNDDISLSVRLAGNILSITIYKVSEEWIQVVEEILLMFLQSLNRNPELRVYIGEFLMSACKVIQTYPTHEMLMTVLDLANWTDFIDDAIVSIFSSVIKQVEKELSKELKVALFRLLYNDSTSDNLVSGSHFIHRPGILPLIFSIFVHFGQTDTFCSILNELCEYSTVNRLMMHQGEFDICILEYLTNFPNQTTFRGTVIEQCSESDLIGLVFVFLNIAATKSSAIVAQKLMTFALKSSMVSKLGPYMIPLDARLEACTRTGIPIGVHGIFTESVDMNVQMFLPGNTVAFKCFLDEPVVTRFHYEVVVCRIVPLMALVIKEMKLYCVTTYSGSEVRHFLADLDPNKWNAVVVLCQEQPDETIHVSAYRNGEATASVCIFGPSGTQDDAFILFGNGKVLTGEFVYAVASFQISTIGFYDFVFSEDEIRRFWNSSLSSSKVSRQPLLVFPETETVRSRFCVAQLFQNDEYCALLPNLSQIFRHVYPVDSLVPAFEKLSEIADCQTFITCVKFFLGSRVSELLDQIAFLLPRNPPLVLSYNLYLAFFELIHTVTSKQALFDIILFNFDIWMRGTAQSIRNILNHWVDIVFRNHKTLFERKGILKSVLLDIRRYLYFDKSKEPLACDFDRDPELEIGSCVDTVYAIILGIAQGFFTSEDMVTYHECIVACKDVRQIEKMLTYATPLLSSVPSGEKISSLLHCLDITEFPSLLPLMFHTLYIGAGKLFYVESILFSYQLPADYQVKALLTELRQFPELFAISLMSAISSPQEQQLEVAAILDDFRSSRLTLGLIGKCKMWIIWPTLFALQCDPAIRSTVLLFISAVISEEGTLESLYKIMSFLDLLEVATSLSPQKMRVILLQNVLSTIDRSKIANFEFVAIERCFQVVYLKCAMDPISSELRKAWEESAFFDGIRESAMKTSRVTSHEDLSNLVAGVADLRYNYVLVVPHDLTMMNSETAALTQIIATLGKDLKTNDFLHYFLKYTNSYPMHRPGKKAQMIRSFAKYEKTVFVPYISSVKKATARFAKKLVTWFAQEDCILREYLTTKANLSDPSVEVLREREHTNELVEDMWTNTVKLFVHERQLFNRDYFIWKRDFHFGNGFSSFKLKRSVISRTPTSKEEFSTRQSLAFFTCKRIKMEKITECKYYLTQDNILLVFGSKSKLISLADVTHIMFRNRAQRVSGLEFYLHSGKSILLDFAPNLASEVSKTLRQVNMPSLVLFNDKGYIQGVSDFGLIRKWKENAITNYDFLMHLNLLSGRSLLDPENYVIFPWIFLDNKTLRNLSLPIAAQSATTIEEYREKIRRAKTTGEDSYLFGTAPSNAMLLSFYFVRIEPYTTLHKNIHDGRFDCQGRMFCSVDEFLHGIEANRECKESTPEFYSFPEAFITLAHGCKVENLVTPEWANGLFDYVYQCRKALESRETAENLHKWIDLVFGYAQRGDEAEERCNLYLPELYSTVWEEATESPEVIASMLKSLGSIPPRIFVNPVGQRIYRKRADAIRLSVELPCKNIDGAYIMGLSMKAVVGVITKSGQVDVHVFALDYELTRTLGGTGQFPKRCVVVAYQSCLFAFDQDNGAVNVITREGEYSKRSTMHMKPDFAVPGIEKSDTLYLADKFGGIRRYNTATGDYGIVMQIMTSSIRAIGISEDLGIIACGTTDGYLEVYSLGNRRFVKSHSLGTSFIRHIIITPSLGLILVKTDQEIWVFTANGFFIKKVECTIDISLWTSWKNRDGIDVVCCCDIDGRVLTFEAYYPERMDVTCLFHHRILDMRFNPEMELLAIVTARPELHVIPIIVE